MVASQARAWRVSTVVVCLVLLGCAAEAGSTSGRGRGSNTGGGAGVSGGDFGNSTMIPGGDPQGTPPPLSPPPGDPSGAGIEPVSIDECLPSNPAGLSAADVQTLMAGSGGPGSVRWLYPYDGTVFPRGLFAPSLMWDGAPAEYVYVHIVASRFEYQGCLVPTAEGRIDLPQAAWDAAGEKTQGASDPFTLELTVMSGGVATGPATQKLVIAQAAIRGSIFYNSYDTKLAGGGGGKGTGAILRIPPGGAAEAFVSNECTGCHSVAAQGTRLISQTILGGGGRSYALAPDTPPNPAPTVLPNQRTAYGALSPDGSVYLAMSGALDVGQANLASGLFAPPSATLYQATTGTPIANSGIPTGALMPMFSPDGTLLVFNDFAMNSARGLAVMDFDVATNTASKHRMVHSDTSLYPGWPFFLPDNEGLVFVRTTSGKFSGEGAGLGGRPLTSAPVSDLHMLDLDTGSETLLARAMGFATSADAAGDKTYLPFGAEDIHRSYFPTVVPVAAGGYFWVFFDGIRHYGNQGLQRQIWGAAVEIAADGDYSVDRSFPAFYLPGQEFGTGNHRAFAALDPCKQDGGSCTAGSDCCGGYCHVIEENSEFGSEPVGTCTAEVPMCARTGERCTDSMDCCPPAAGEPVNSCIAGYCAFIRAPQ